MFQDKRIQPQFYKLLTTSVEADKRENMLFNHFKTLHFENKKAVNLLNLKALETMCFNQSPLPRPHNTHTQVNEYTFHNA